MCMKGDPNYDNPTARRELPLLDEQDAYFQIETLYNPNGYWVTPPNGIPRMNIRRIMTHVNIALSLLTGMRPGAAYKTDNTDELEQARLRDVQIKRLRQDELGWLFASVFDDSLGLKNGTMDDSLQYVASQLRFRVADECPASIPSFLRGIGALDKLLLDLTLLIIMLGLRRKRFKHFETLADLWRKHSCFSAFLETDPCCMQAMITMSCSGRTSTWTSRSLSLKTAHRTHINESTRTFASCSSAAGTTARSSSIACYVALKAAQFTTCRPTASVTTSAMC
jgi:hypothetical protein